MGSATSTISPSLITSPPTDKLHNESNDIGLCDKSRVMKLSSPQAVYYDAPIAIANSVHKLLHDHTIAEELDEISTNKIDKTDRSEILCLPIVEINVLRMQENMGEQQSSLNENQTNESLNLPILEENEGYYFVAETSSNDNDLIIVS